MAGIDGSLSYSSEKLEAVRAAVSAVVPSNQLVVTCGSYARREASPSSDMDYYAILDGEVDPQVEPPWSADLREQIEKVVGKLPAAQGAFAANVSEHELLQNYGDWVFDKPNREA